MKKTLIAVAALVATGAFAQTTVAITGSFDPSLAMTKTTSGTDVAVAQTFIRNNSRGTTNVTFRVTEDLGGGMSASGLAEFDFAAGAQTNQPINVFAGFTGGATAPQNNVFGANGGELYTALNGGFGSIRLGAANTPSLGSQAGRQPFGTKMGGGFGTTMGTSHVRESNSLVYVSPAMAGFSAALGHMFKVNTDATSTLPAAFAGSKTDIGLNYAAGPLRAGGTFFSGQSVGQQNYFAQYDIGAATIYAGAHRAKAAGVDSNTGSNIALKYNLSGTTSVMANLGKFDDKTAANADSTITGLGMDYALSKRTTAYIRYENRKIDNIVAAASIKQQTTTAFGLQHNF
jgi:predicted porin